MTKNWKLIYWLAMLCLSIPLLVKSFVVNLKNVVNSMRENKLRKEVVIKLKEDNQELYKKLKHYQSEEGIKSLVKDKLYRVEKDELIIKYDHGN